MSSTPLRSMFAVALACAAATLGGCGDDPAEEGPCTLGSNAGCRSGRVCEAVADGEPTCFAPVELRGRVFDLTTEDGLAGATVVALDANGGARTAVVMTAADGTFALPIAATRNASGVPVAESVTLRVAAAGYEPFATAPRTALPVPLEGATVSAGDPTWVVASVATEVGLIPLPEDVSGYGSVAGTVDVSAPAGVLVIAEQAGVAVSTAITDLNGAFLLFNVPPGETVLTAYRAGLVVAPEVVTATSGRLDGVVLEASAEGLGRVSGTLSIVNAPGGSVTSVILAVASTYDDDTRRGEAPAGLRVGGVSGAWAIEGVPPGDYVVLAAFENDGLVRDPDETIGGTATQQVTVGPGQDVTVPGFKVTEALAVVSPGPEALEVVATTTPTLSWADDSSEDGYELRVHDATGELVFEDLEVPRVTGSSSVSYDLPESAALSPGLIYQFQVASFAQKAGEPRTYLSTTEDLLGVFQIELP